jgi:hypothetical protein
LDRIAQLLLAGETGSGESLPLHHAEDDFDLVEPTGGSGGEMKMDAAGELFQPFLVFLCVQ